MVRRRPSEDPASRRLLDRILESGARRVAILGLHPRAGSRTVLAALVRDLHRRGLGYGVSSFPRPPHDDHATPEPVTRIALPAGATVASAAVVNIPMELVESTRFESPLGQVGLYRITEGGEVELYGPSEPADMGATLGRLADVAGGVALVDGGWVRRGFAAPGVTDGIVLVLSAGYSASPERSAAAARYVVETFDLDVCSAEERGAWEQAAGCGEALALGGDAEVLLRLPMLTEGPSPALIDGERQDVAGIVLPRNLDDELLAPLIRAPLRCRLVVRDATRIRVSPVYLQAWRKSGGDVRVVHRARILALATNPVNLSGPDADAREFRARVAQAMPGLPVHDVALESSERSRRAVWRFWD